MTSQLSRTTLGICVLIAGTIIAHSQAQAQLKKHGKTVGNPSTNFVLFYTPGAKWVDSLSFREQPGVMEHVMFMAGCQKNGTLVMGGPFLDNSGGMMILNVASIEEAERIAAGDPTVKAGLLNVKVRKWMVAMMGNR